MLDLLSGACPYRKTGAHPRSSRGQAFSGTCAMKRELQETSWERTVAKYLLVSFKTCPWVQRAAIVLREKKIDFEFRHIDRDNRPDWFLAISPHKKVPVLRLRSEEHTSELQSLRHLVCRLLLEKK